MGKGSQMPTPAPFLSHSCSSGRGLPAEGLRLQVCKVGAGRVVPGGSDDAEGISKWPAGRRVGGFEGQRLRPAANGARLKLAVRRGALPAGGRGGGKEGDEEKDLHYNRAGCECFLTRCPALGTRSGPTPTPH